MRHFAVDDLNSCTGIETTIKEIVRDCHERSKRLIITSNVAPETIINQLYPAGQDHESKGFIDRFHPHLLHQKITTDESFRHKGLENMLRYFALGDENQNSNSSQAAPQSLLTE